MGPTAHDQEAVVDNRRLVLGLSVLLLVAGIALACFTPGGFFNRQQEHSVEMPFFGTMTVRGEGATSAWPVAGYVLLGLGGLGLVLAYAMKPPPRV
jgi:hypothetical protein